jgi:ketosteroid isomerase-like protein
MSDKLPGVTRARGVAIAFSVLALSVPVLRCSLNVNQPPPAANVDGAVELVTARGAAFSHAIKRASASGWKPEQVDALVAFYTDDAILFPPRGEAIRGRAEILRYWLRSPDRKILDHTVTVDSVVASSDVIADYGTIALKSQVSENTPATSTAHYLSVWKREPDGVWRKRIDSWW